MKRTDSLFLRKLLDVKNSPSIGTIGTYRKFLEYVGKDPQFQHLLKDDCVKVTLKAVDDLLATKSYDASSVTRTIGHVLQRLISVLLETQTLEVFYHPSVKLVLSRQEKDEVVYYELKATGEINGDGAPEYTLYIDDLTLTAVNARFSHFSDAVQRRSWIARFHSPETVIAKYHEMMAYHAGIPKPLSERNRLDY